MRPASHGSRPPEHRLERLAEVVELMLRYTSRPNHLGVLEMALRELHAILHAEDVSLFVRRRGKKAHVLYRLAAYGDRDEMQPKSLRVTSGGLCERLFARDEPLRLAKGPLREELSRLPHGCPSYLSAKETYSIMAVPLCDRKGRPTYFLKASNKKGPSGLVDPDEEFTAEDVQVARVVGLTLATHLEYENLIQVVQQGVGLLTAAADQNKGEADIGKSLASEARRVTKAGAVRFYSRNEVNAPSLPDPPERADDLTGLLRASLADSEGIQRDKAGGIDRLAVAVGPKADRWGALYLEAGDRQGFDARDELAVHLLAEQANGALRLQRTVAEWLDQFESDPGPPRKVLRRILDTAQVVWRFAKGVIYLAEEGVHKMRCAETTGCGQEGQADQFPDCPFTDDGVIAAAYFEEKVECSPPGAGGCKMCDRFELDAPCMAVSLSHDGRRLGVLAVWGGELRLPATADQREDLLAFARIAAAYLAAAREEISDVSQRLSTALPAEVRETGRAEHLRGILSAVSKAGGFERVRLFAFDGPNKQFLPIDCLRMNRQVFLTRNKIRIEQNVYAKDIAETFMDGPRVYGPGSGRDLGLDPHRHVLDKPDGVPWAVAPIVQGGRLLGYLVADQGRTGRPVLDGSLEVLRDEATRAAPWVKGRAWQSSVSLVGLPRLFHWAAASTGPYAVTKRLLGYLTCGDALGFSRAVFLGPDESGANLVYRAGTGSISHANFARISQRTRTMDLDDVLRAAPDTDDLDIADALHDRLAIEVASDEEGLLLAARLHEPEADARSEQRSDWRAVLAEAFGEGRVATVPVYRREKLLGLFVVDRRWQDRDVSKHDLVALQRFAAEAATILVEQESDRATTLQAEWDPALAHACRGGISSIASDAENIRLKIGQGGGRLPAGDADIANNVRSIKQVADELTRICEQIYNVVTPGEDSREASLRDVLESVAWRFERHRVKYHPWPEDSRDNDAPTDIEVALNRDILKWVIDELARNACRALAKWASPYDPFDYFFQPDPEVRVQVFLRAPIPRTLDRYQQYALLLFGDNGKGIDWEMQPKVFLPGKAGNSSREQGGTGFGLSLVRKTIEAHRGLIGFNSAPGSGCTFYLYLPLAKCGITAPPPPDQEAPL